MGAQGSLRNHLDASSTRGRSRDNEGNDVAVRPVLDRVAVLKGDVSVAQQLGW